MTTWLFASGLALIAGFAIARGGICAVAGVKQLVEARRAQVFLSFIECSAWALLALMIANALGLMSIAAWPMRMSVVGAVVGGALFGAGALLNGACAFGTVARIGSGDVSFLALIPGFLAGAWSLRQAGKLAEPTAETGGHSASATLALVLVVLSAFALWRLWTAARFARVSGNVAHLTGGAWPPALAVAIIALANVTLLLLVSSWPYTSLLTDLAYDRRAEVFGRTMLALALLAGAVAGTTSAGMFRLRVSSLGDGARHFGGGALMGAGAALIPGGNDSLVLIGLPLLQPSAAAAYVAMVGVIAAGLALRQLLWRRQPGQP